MPLDDTKQFAGKLVLDWEVGDPLPDPATTIPRFRSAYGQEEGLEKFRAFLTNPGSSATMGLVFGLLTDTAEDYTTELVQALIEHSEHFQHLAALFLGDMSSEESEISWIGLGDVAPLFSAYPHLEHFHILGCATSYTGTGLHFGILHHEHLKTLIVETGSMDRSVVHDILRSHLPALEHLELWTGAETYGANCTVEDFVSLFTTTLFPNLRYLGLRDSEIANDLAIALSQSPLLERIRELDLSLGLLDDTGATALLNCPAVSKLAKLDLHHHYCSQEMMQRLQALNIEFDVSEVRDPDVWEGEENRYVAVSE